MFTLREHFENMNKTQILQQALRATRDTAGLQWTDVGPLNADHQALLTLVEEGATKVFCATVAAVDRLQALRLLQQRNVSSGTTQMLVVPYLSATLAQECRALGMNFIDTAGNASIEIPGVRIFVTGNPRPRMVEDARSHSALRTANGLRVVFALLTEPGLVHQPLRNIAAHAGVALGSVGKVLEDLQRQGHLSTGKGAERRLLAVDELSAAWAQHYPVSLRHKLHPRRYALAPGRDWRNMSLQPGEAVWGAEMAAYRMDGYLQPAQAVMYSWVGRESLMLQYRLRPDAGGEVEVVDAFWHPQSPETSVLAPPLLVYADLMASPDGRCREAAARLWEGMQHV